MPGDLLSRPLIEISRRLCLPIMPSERSTDRDRRFSVATAVFLRPMGSIIIAGAGCQTQLVNGKRCPYTAPAPIARN